MGPKVSALAVEDEDGPRRQVDGAFLDLLLAGMAELHRDTRAQAEGANRAEEWTVCVDMRRDT